MSLHRNTVIPNFIPNFIPNRTDLLFCVCLPHAIFTSADTFNDAFFLQFTDVFFDLAGAFAVHLIANIFRPFQGL